MSDRQRKSGAAFEVELAKILSDHGFWVHRLVPSANGQPGDILAVDKYVSMLIDCKDCEKNIFPLSRIEPNQLTAMQRWEDRTESPGFFALKIDSGIYWIPFSVLLTLLNGGVKKLNEKDITDYGIPNEEFL